MAEPWSVRDIPDLHGRVIVVTGANQGLGFWTTRHLASKGALVVLACRTASKAEAAIMRIKASTPGSRLGAADEHPKLVALPLDLADLASVRAFAEAFTARFDRLDVLVNNAGLMAVPYGTTAQGFELQFGVNHLGPFALTGLLLPRLLDTTGSRVVTVSSVLHALGVLTFDEPEDEDHYWTWGAYGRSKFANLLFTYALQRQLSRAGASTIACATHPGYADTELQVAGARLHGSRVRERGMAFMSRLVAQSPEQGALPTLRAATDPGANGGDYFGPGGLFGLRGAPKRVRPHPRALDEELARRLWSLSVERTGIDYAELMSPPAQGASG